MSPTHRVPPASGSPQLSPLGITLDLARPLRLEGVALSDGIALGHAVLHEPRVVVTNLFNENIEHEISRLREALERLQISIDVLFRNGSVPSEGEHRDILEAYRMFAHTAAIWWLFIQVNQKN